MPDGALGVANNALHRITSHEQLCEERWREVRDDMRDVKGTIKGFTRMGIGVIITMLLWAGAQLYAKVDAGSVSSAVSRTVQSR